MTRIHERIETALPIDARLRLHRRLRQRPRMGPGHASIRGALDDGPVGLGARFALDVRMGGRIAPMEYRIRDFERPDRVVLVGDGVGRRRRRRHPLRARR